MQRLSLLLLCLILSATSFAAVDVYEFENQEQKQRYQHLIDELRCPKCQNQNLADSDAPIAQDLRRELHRLLLEGRSDEAVLEFMVQRYGNFVLYRPPLDQYTWILWTAPLFLLALGLLAAWRMRRSSALETKHDGLTDAELQHVQQLVAQYGKSGEGQAE